jgi:hypothetical protein
MRGKVTFTAGDKDYSLRFTTNRLCQLEEDTGKGVMAFAAELSQAGGVSIKLLRLLMRAGLEGAPSAADVGDIIDAVGIQASIVLIGRAFNAAFDLGDKPAEADLGKPVAGAA